MGDYSEEKMAAFIRAARGYMSAMADLADYAVHKRGCCANRMSLSHWSCDCGYTDAYNMAALMRDELDASAASILGTEETEPVTT